MKQIVADAIADTSDSNSRCVGAFPPTIVVDVVVLSKVPSRRKGLAVTAYERDSTGVELIEVAT